LQGYISGEDNCFTIYQEQKSNDSYGCISNSVTLASGCLDDEGNILNHATAIKMTNVNSNFLCFHIPRFLKISGPMPLGNVRLISERDGIMERISD
jgi:hypothetical protein